MEMRYIVAKDVSEIENPDEGMVCFCRDKNEAYLYTKNKWDVIGTAGTLDTLGVAVNNPSRGVNMVPYAYDLAKAPKFFSEKLSGTDTYDKNDMLGMNHKGLMGYDSTVEDITSDNDYKITENEIEMLYKTLAETRERGGNTRQIERIIEEKEEAMAVYKNKQAYLGRPYSRLTHSFRDDAALLTDKVAHQEYIRNNGFLVHLPIEGIDDTYIQYFSASALGREGTIKVKVIDVEGMGIYKRLMDYFADAHIEPSLPMYFTPDKTNLCGDDEERIVLDIVGRDGSIIYKRVYTNVHLDSVEEDTFSYENSDPHSFYLTFSYNGMYVQDV